MSFKFQLISNAKALLEGTREIKKIVDNFENLTEEKQNAFVREKLQAIISYSVDKVPYYKKLFSDHGLTIDSIKEPNDLEKIPILTKDIIRKEDKTMKSIELNKMDYIIRRSGGTTGEPIASYISKEARAFETFTYLRGLLQLGWRPSMTFVKVFGGTMGIKNRKSLKGKVYDFMMNALNLPAFELDEYSVDRYYKLIKERRNVCIIGYPSAINNLVNLLKGKNYKLHNIDLVITTSEQLIFDWKINIEEYFNCQVRSYYGCGEVGSLGYQAQGGNESYHIPIDNVILRNNGNTQDILITQLHNKAMPLINYKHGDLGFISKDGKTIEQLVGRSADSFVRSDGTLVSPIFGTHSILNSNIPVQKYQYVQKENGEISFLYYMNGKTLNDQQKKTISGIVSYVMNEKVEITFESTNDFFRSQSGKHRICVRI